MNAAEFVIARVPPRARPAALAAAGILVLVGALSLALMVLPAHGMADVTHYKYWARLVALEGVSGAYSGQYPETAAIYPPTTMYGYRAAGLIYRRVYDPEFAMDRALASRALTVLVKLVAVVPHLVLTAVLYLLLASRHSPAAGLVGAAAYGLNPAALFDTAYWGQPDPAHSLFLLLGTWLLAGQRPVAGWAVLGLAAATKPQAWALLPFAAYLSLRRFGVVASIRGGAVAAAAAAAVCLPFFVHGTASDLLKLPSFIAETMPVASANAHNVWWLLTLARPDFVLDAEPLVGPVTYRVAALILAVLVYAFGLAATPRQGSAESVLAMGAFLGFGWFLVTTRAHENHAFFVLPLLAAAAPGSSRLWALFAVISATSFLNMAMHDFSLAPLRDSVLSPETWVRLQLLNAAVNVAVFVVWSAWLAPRLRLLAARPGPTRLRRAS